MQAHPSSIHSTQNTIVLQQSTILQAPNGSCQLKLDNDGMLKFYKNNTRLGTLPTAMPDFPVQLAPFTFLFSWQGIFGVNNSLGEMMWSVVPPTPLLPKDGPCVLSLDNAGTLKLVDNKGVRLWYYNLASQIGDVPAIHVNCSKR
jgi:hypothetical protein